MQVVTHSDPERAGAADQIDRYDRTPVYAQLADLIARRIRDGEVTGRLPSEVALARHYHAAPVTVRRALQLLRTDRLILTIPGRGSYVRPARLATREASHAERP